MDDILGGRGAPRPAPVADRGSGRDTSPLAGQPRSSRPSDDGTSSQPAGGEETSVEGIDDLVREFNDQGSSGSRRGFLNSIDDLAAGLGEERPFAYRPAMRIEYGSAAFDTFDVGVRWLLGEGVSGVEDALIDAMNPSTFARRVIGGFGIISRVREIGAVGSEVGSIWSRTSSSQYAGQYRRLQRLEDRLSREIASAPPGRRSAIESARFRVQDEMSGVRRLLRSQGIEIP